MSAQQYAARCAVHRAALVACIALSSACCAGSVRAETAVALPVYDVQGTEHNSTASDRRLGADQTAIMSTRDATPIGAAPAFAPMTATSRFNVIELPPDASSPGTYKRPHHGLGYRWSAAESWLRDHGLDARTCYLPMVRMHTRVGPGGASGTLWVYGRCSFR